MNEALWESDANTRWRLHLRWIHPAAALGPRPGAKTVYRRFNLNGIANARLRRKGTVMEKVFWNVKEMRDWERKKAVYKWEKTIEWQGWSAAKHQSRAQPCEGRHKDKRTVTQDGLMMRNISECHWMMIDISKSHEEVGLPANIVKGSTRTVSGSLVCYQTYCDTWFCPGAQYQNGCRYSCLRCDL